MPKNDALINKGVVVIGDQDDKIPSPIIVIGTARGVPYLAVCVRV